MQNPDEIMRLNEWWHDRNLDYLRRAIRYAQDNMPMEVENMLHAYVRDESDRLSERASLMLNNKIEKYPHIHREEARQLWLELIAIIDAKTRRKVEQKDVQATLFEEGA